MNFNGEKNGYSKMQVDDYVSSLEKQVADLTAKNKQLETNLEQTLKRQSNFQEKSQTISVALTAAVEKARQIEQSSKNVYKLKIQQLELLYNRWETFLSEMLEKYPNVEDVENVKQIMGEFKTSIKNTLKDDFKITSLSSVQTDSDPIRVLLGRMNEHFKKAPVQKHATIERKPLSKDITLGQTELSRIEEKAPSIKPINETLDEYLKEQPEQSAYADQITKSAYPETNESGFNLREAVNPKDDLEEIMKAFDFYDEDKKEE